MVQDAATLYQIIKWLRAMTHHLKLTVLISLLQPPPETFALFDDLMIMNEGTIVYHDTVPGAVPFVQELGFQLPPRKVRLLA
jgi:ABC-type multidrug transport system ATPase subunit